MQTQKVWCQNFLLLSLWKEIQPFLTAVSDISRHVEKKSMVSKLLIALIVERHSAFLTRSSKMSTLVEIKLLVALIMIRNSAFIDRNFWNFKTWRHKKYGVKTFIALIVKRIQSTFFDSSFWNFKTWEKK